MAEVKNKTEGQQVIKEVDEYMKNYSILTRTRNIRKSIERETRKMKELCVLVFHFFLIVFSFLNLHFVFRKVRKQMKIPPVWFKLGKRPIQTRKES
jgi:hypothetical protein